ncbi:MAG TPA: HlyD family secretion protein [Opitutaceae bacterium]|nr:HlyD family secretion protein [Opitutaceae bacterium]
METDSATLERPAPKTPPANARTPVAAPPINRAPNNTGRFRPRNLIFGAVAILGVAWGVHFGLHAYHYENTDDAYVTGHLHRVSAQVTAEVKELRVEDNQRVSAGQILAVLDPTTFQVALDKAKAGLAQATAQKQQAHAAVEQAIAQFAGAEARADQAAAQVQQLEAQRDLARVTLSRTEQLFNNTNGAATQADLDAARSAFQSADAAVNAARANIAATKAAIESSKAARDASIAQESAADANIAAAQSAIQDAQVKLGYTVITSPVAGRVGNRSIELGNRVQDGQAIMAIASADMWVVANFKETQLAHMHAGQEVELTIDALPGQTFSGKIDSLAPASGAQFALLPADNATGNFNKVVQRVPVKITLSPEDLEKFGDRLRLGLSAVVDVKVR